MAYTDVAKKNLMDAFWRIYKEKDLRDITVKEVTDLAGYHRNTFYRHFSSLDEVLDKIEEPLLNFQANQDYLSRGSEPDLLIPLFQKYFSDNAEYLHVLFGPNGDRNFIEIVKETFRPSFAKNYASYLKIQNPELDLVYEFIFAGFNALCNKWYGEYRKQFNPEQVKAVMDAICHILRDDLHFYL